MPRSDERGLPRNKFSQTTELIPGAPETAEGFPRDRGNGGLHTNTPTPVRDWVPSDKKLSRLYKKTMNWAEYTARGLACSSFRDLAGSMYIMIQSSQKPWNRGQEGEEVTHRGAGPALQ